MYHLYVEDWQLLERWLWKSSCIVRYSVTVRGGSIGGAQGARAPQTRTSLIILPWFLSYGVGQLNSSSVHCQVQLPVSVHRLQRLMWQSAEEQSWSALELVVDSVLGRCWNFATAWCFLVMIWQQRSTSSGSFAKIKFYCHTKTLN